MKKRLFALLCTLILLVGAIPSAGALAGEANRSADILNTLGLVNGTADAEYNLTAPATRAQAAVLLVRLAGAEDAAAADPWFAGYRDVPAWCKDAVDYATHQGWLTGVTALDFQPNSTITANAWCTCLLRMLGYRDKDGDFTPSDAALFAQRIGLISVAYSGPLTRGDLFEMARDALTFSYKDGSATVIEHLVDSGCVSRSTASALGLLAPELTARQMADQHMAAVFRLDLYDKQEEIDAGTPSANASGFFIMADGTAVTNYHTIDGAIYATATLSTGEVYPVEKVLYYDANIDIAVLQISPTSTIGKTTSAFAYLELAGTHDIRAGDTVYALGNPLGLGLAVSSGIISATARDVERYALPCVMNTADISEGSSGGALLNIYGQVIAVTSGAYIYGNNMYLAVPVDPVLTADLSGEGLTLKQVAAIQNSKAAASGKAQ